MKIRLEKLSLIVASVSVAFHVLALVLAPDVGSVRTFRTELEFFILLSAATAVVETLLPSLRLFIVAHTVRAAALFIVFAIFEGSSLACILLVSTPFVMETAIYLGLRKGIAANSAFIVGLVIELTLTRNLTAAPPGYVVTVTAFTAAMAALGALLIRYRERIVEDTIHVFNLNSTVTNLSNANRSFQQYADNVESVSATRERNRITRELHDVTGYALTSIVMSMNAGKLLVAEEPDELMVLLEDTRKQAEEALRETRVTLYKLRAIKEMKTEGLHAINRLVVAFGKATGITIDLHYGNMPFSLGPTIDGAMWRFVQEGLTNAFRHGKASVVRVNMWRTATDLTMSIRDNGRGAHKVEEGIGLKGMKERFQALGGTIVAGNAVDGFEIRGAIPVRTEQTSE